MVFIYINCKAKQLSHVLCFEKQHKTGKRLSFYEYAPRVIMQKKKIICFGTDFLPETLMTEKQVHVK